MKKNILLFMLLFSISINAQQIINEDVQIGTNIPFGSWGPQLRFGTENENTDPIFFSRYNLEDDRSELRLIIGDYPEERDKFSIGYKYLITKEYVPKFVIQADGKVGIETTTPQNELDVNGTIRSNNILIPNGKLGIGNDNPQYDLDVTGIIHLNGVGTEGVLQLGGNIPFGSWGPQLRFGTENENTDPIFFSRYNLEDDRSELRLIIGDYPEERDKFLIGYRDLSTREYVPKFAIQADGRVGIGTVNPQNELDVNGTIRAKEIKVESGWADFVFKKDYRLPTLKEVEEHINENGTLPSVPTEQEVKANGINLAETNALLLQKIEELTLYIIQQDKRIETLESKMNNVSGNNK